MYSPFIQAIREHPKNLTANHIVQYLEFLAVTQKVAPSTQKTALNALMYLYKRFLNWDQALLDLGDFHRAKAPKKIPVVLSKNEIRSVFACLQGEYLSCAKMMYGSDLRVMEVCRLRVKDIDFERLAVAVNDGKGKKTELLHYQNLVLETFVGNLRYVRSIFRKILKLSDGMGFIFPIHWQENILMHFLNFPGSTCSLPVSDLSISVKTR